MKLGRWAGIELRINEWLLLMFAVFIWAGVGQEIALVFLSLLWHEAGHLLAARRLGFDVQEVEFYPYGGVAKLAPGAMQTVEGEIAIALAGPLASLLMILIVEGSIVFFGYGGVWGEFLQTVNLSLALFNLLPIIPLDGGRVLRAWMGKSRGVLEASSFTATLGQTLAILLGICSVLALYIGWAGLDWPLLAGFLFLGAKRERMLGPMVFWRFLKSKRNQLIHQGAWSADCVVAREDLPIAQLLQNVVPERCLVITVVDAGGRIIGQAAEGDLLEEVMRDNSQGTLGDLIRKK